MHIMETTLKAEKEKDETERRKKKVRSYIKRCKIPINISFSAAPSPLTLT